MKIWDIKFPYFFNKTIDKIMIQAYNEYNK